MTKLDSILKSRVITFLTKVHLVQVMVFPIVMYGSESWTIKKAERRRTGAFELWGWRRLLRFPWAARRPNQLIPKEITLEYSLEEKQSRTLWSLCPHPPAPCFLCAFFSMENFKSSERISLIREMRNAETKKNSQRRLNNNNVVINHSQGL